MKRISGLIALALFVVAPLLIVAQEPPAPAPPAPEKEHEWLSRFVGEWEIESDCFTDDPKKPSTKCKGTMSSKKLGDYWIVNDLTGYVDKTKIQALQTIGYDAHKKKFVGAWIDNMMPHMWKYEGSIDACGTKVVLEAMGPNMLDPKGKMVNYRDSYEFKSKDSIYFTSEHQDESGNWKLAMKGEFKRKVVKVEVKPEVKIEIKVEVEKK